MYESQGRCFGFDFGCRTQQRQVLVNCFFVVKWSFEGDCSCPEVLPGKIGTAQVFGILISKGGNKETPFGYVCMIYGACTVGDSFDCRKNERRARRG